MGENAPIRPRCLLKRVTDGYDGERSGLCDDRNVPYSLATVFGLAETVAFSVATDEDAFVYQVRRSFLDVRRVP